MANIPLSDPSAEETRGIIYEILILCKEDTPSSKGLLTQYKAPIISTAALLILSYLYWYSGYSI